MPKMPKVEETEQLKWSNLQINKCPKCNGDLTLGLNYNPSTRIMKHACGFQISENKFSQIVQDRINKSFDYESMDDDYKIGGSQKGKHEF